MIDEPNLITCDTWEGEGSSIFKSWGTKKLSESGREASDKFAIGVRQGQT